ncbi:hypothetical protein ACOME3_003537 [Neoechinorhynchus agilis]
MNAIYQTYPHYRSICLPAEHDDFEYIDDFFFGPNAFNERAHPNALLTSVDIAENLEHQKTLNGPYYRIYSGLRRQFCNEMLRYPLSYALMLIVANLWALPFYVTFGKIFNFFYWSQQQSMIRHSDEQHAEELIEMIEMPQVAVLENEENQPVPVIQPEDSVDTFKGIGQQITSSEAVLLSKVIKNMQIKENHYEVPRPPRQPHSIGLGSQKPTLMKTIMNYRLALRQNKPMI